MIFNIWLDFQAWSFFFLFLSPQPWDCLLCSLSTVSPVLSFSPHHRLAFSHPHLLGIFQLHLTSISSGHLKLALSNSHSEHIFAVLNALSSVNIPPLLCIFPFFVKKNATRKILASYSILPVILLVAGPLFPNFLYLFLPQTSLYLLSTWPFSLNLIYSGLARRGLVTRLVITLFALFFLSIFSLSLSLSPFLGHTHFYTLHVFRNGDFFFSPFLLD